MDTQKIEKPQRQDIFAIFEENLSQEIQNLLTQKNIMDVLKTKFWSIENLNFIKGQWSLLFSSMTHAKCLNFSPCISIFLLRFQQTLKILKHISKTNFLQLKFLCLCTFITTLVGNNIASIEQLQFINMPLLFKLALTFNQITKTSALNKCNWKTLKYLDLSQNPIQELQIQRLQMLNPQVDKKYYMGNLTKGQNWHMVMAKIDINVVELYQSQEQQENYSQPMFPKPKIVKILKKKGLKLLLDE